MAEFMLVLPALMLILLAIVQFGVVFKDYLTLTDAVREGARKAAVARHRTDRDSYVKEEVVKSASDLTGDFDEDDVAVTTSWTPGGDIEVKASYKFDISLLWVVVKNDAVMTSTATERVE